MDVGALNVKLLKHLNPGEPAPPLTITTVDNQKWDLAEQKGKVVLMLFWTIRRESSIDEFKPLIEQFAANPRITVLAVNVDRDPKAAQEAATKHGMTWPLAAPEDLGILNQLDTSFPGMVVVGADGTIVQNHIFQAKYLKKFVDRALAQ